ncbi:MAG: hypothetical protein A2440_13545 [Stygiobacter sp. RIFOXYC2_FULL_38_25]|nr:MAG: hypothetical protein A2X62_06410 [Stygiobacter sp. GWC2_38_9]OGV06884.1 MAG: hypothetical protein A2299_03165 [Stygiobacter sp. RIFOXYB2_FULL_37_11]OGV11584.1 MAG: hypothetical protein A2237_04920 [Stygiobacter sp. RIFOXYA2_FULL_38_8]OGV13343.1 MAG: hypothetical protein A2440_13545 [Stygiobacter sp. RIFOXYC2_FULL_38_25]OGV83389.1 MAG: hypothetical protein A2X65_17100 [Stygiobacter sp. GWF2_38_21]OGV83789.1 MAG: hypothetical protein A3J88_01940 [Melioribacter sp. RIFOXYB12_FULL_38_5]
MSSKARVIAITISLCIFFISCERSVFTGYEEPKPENNKIQITSNPSNAKIYLNGKNTGFTTPSLLTWIESGKDTIGLKLFLYRDTTFITDIKGAAEQKRFIDFKANPGNYGNISCVSSPLGASILLNKSKTYRTTPHTFSKLEPGIHSITITKAEHREDSTNVTLAASTTTQVNIILEDTTKWVSYNPKNSQVQSELVYSITTDMNNRIWFGSLDGLSKFDGKRWTTYTKSNSALRANVINTLLVDKQNRIWIGTTRGIYVIINGTLIDYSLNLPDQTVVGITESIDGTIWTAIAGGVCKLSNSKWELLKISNSGLHDNFPTCIASDDNNRVWIGSRSFGIAILDGSKWSYIPTSSMNVKDISPGVASICFSKEGTIWISTNSPSGDVGKVYFFKNNSWSHYSQTELNNNVIRQIKTWNDNVGFATRFGLGILSPSNEFKYFKKGNTKLWELNVYQTTFDNDGNIWIATSICGAAKLKKGF